MQLSPMVRRTAISVGVGVGTAGLLAGVLLLGPVAASILLVVVFVLVWPLAAVVRHVAEDAPFKSPVMVAACAAGIVLCFPGLVRLLAWGAGGLLLAVATAGLFVLVDLAFSHRPRHRPANRRSPRRRRQAAYGELVQSSTSDGDDLEDEKLIASLQCPLSIEELCGVWRETSTKLADGAGPRDRQAVAEVRRICLDEFERRNPEGFQRWIEAGAPGDPGTFLLPKPGE